MGKWGGAVSVEVIDDEDTTYAEEFAAICDEEAKLGHLIERLTSLNAGVHRSRELSVALTELQTGRLWLGAFIGTVDVLEEDAHA